MKLFGKLILCGIACLMLAGCEDRYSLAERRFNMVNEGGTRGEICLEAKDVADLYLNGLRQEQYEIWQTRADVLCMNAGFMGWESYPQA